MTTPISTIILTFNEEKHIERCILNARRFSKEIFVVDSFSTDNTIEIAKRLGAIVYQNKWEKNYARQFNWGLMHLPISSEWVFRLDADEYLTNDLIHNLEDILNNNIDKDLVLVPRINTVEGLTAAHIQKWGWVVDGKGRVNWPDLQWRIYKRAPHIKWKNKVHEVLEGHRNFSALPSEPEFSLKHPKDIVRQEKQNAYYETLG